MILGIHYRIQGWNKTSLPPTSIAVAEIQVCCQAPLSNVWHRAVPSATQPCQYSAPTSAPGPPQPDPGGPQHLRKQAGGARGLRARPWRGLCRAWYKSIGGSPSSGQSLSRGTTTAPQPPAVPCPRRRPRGAQGAGPRKLWEEGKPAGRDIKP